jgi:colanic acid biosynthesis protein WcaH
MLKPAELKQLTVLLRKIDNPRLGLPQAVFDELVKIVPFVACELIIVGKKGILLTWREDNWWRGWHFPGGLLRYKESFAKRIRKTAWEELGIRIKKYRFLFPANYPNSPRNHGVSLIFLCTTDMPPKDGKFFKKMPRDIINEHKKLWNKIIRKIENL